MRRKLSPTHPKIFLSSRLPVAPPDLHSFPTRRSSDLAFRGCAHFSALERREKDSERLGTRATTRIYRTFYGCAHFGCFRGRAGAGIYPQEDEKIGRPEGGGMGLLGASSSALPTSVRMRREPSSTYTSKSSQAIS